MDTDGSDEGCVGDLCGVRGVWWVMRGLRSSCCCCPYNPGRDPGTLSTFRRPPSTLEAQVLVLGAADTGKSTFMKQMRYVFGDRYPAFERRRYQPYIRRNLLESLHKMVRFADAQGVRMSTSEAQDAAEKFRDLSTLEKYFEVDEPLDNNDASILEGATKTLWQDPGLQEVYSRGNEYHLMTNADHFIHNAATILRDDYCPTVEDILRMRYPTRSSVMSTYNLGEMTMTLQDMGGERPERKEWVKLILHPTAILFLASLSEYDQCVEEAKDEGKNRVKESLEIFEDVLGYPTFENIPIILLLNKSDVFRKKIRVHPLVDYFPQYQGAVGDEMAGREFLSGLYEKLAIRYHRLFVVRFTEATDTENFRAIFAFIKNNVCRNMMSRGGLLCGILDECSSQTDRPNIGNTDTRIDSGGRRGCGGGWRLYIILYPSGTYIKETVLSV
ncbi:hypothetical protein Pmani_024426 [Petrolisthes manimaculis]|uniref:Uncharacterized protein n=1 Tax=Petrolisthes manimaculis TaxID=1843537 RepID=A0AAE1P874_9EUCA|nr:hypothetical protein Pmani_024426 [Petrolisthes manimaculis]